MFRPGDNRIQERKGNTKYFTYDKNSRIVAVTDRNGNTTQYKLDGNGNIVETIDAAGTSNLFEYDSMNRLVKIKMHRVDTIHKVDEWQETLYTYDHRGLVKTEVNAKGDGKVFVYDGNGNLISKTDEDGYVTEYEYSPVNLVSKISYDDGQTVSYLYDGTGDLIEMTDWNGTTTIGVDLLDRIVKVTDHNDRVVEYGYDAVGNKTSQGYPDGTQVDYWYDAENQIIQVQDFDNGITLYTYDANGNKTSKEYPNYETAYYFYDEVNQVIEMDEYRNDGEKLYKTLYSYDAEGNRLSDNRYNHGQSTEETDDTTTTASTSAPEDVLTQAAADPTTALSGEQAVVNGVTLPTDELSDTAAGAYLDGVSESIAATNQSVLNNSGAATTSNENTGKEDATIEGNGDGNGQVPPGQSEDEDGNIVNNGGNMAPGLNRGKKYDKDENPNKPDKPSDPGTEDSSDAKANKGTNEYTYDELNRIVTSTDGKTVTNYTYDTLGNLIREKTKNTTTDYQYNCLNQLVQKKSQNKTYTYSYDKRGNRISETQKEDTQTYVYDATNRMVSGTNTSGDTSAYTYNGLGLRVNNTVTTHAGKVYSRDYVIDYTSPENDDLYVYAMGNGSLEYEQKHVYVDSERIEQYTERGSGSWERLLYVHEDVMGNTYYYTKTNGGTFADLEYDAWGMPQSPNKLVNNDHGNYVFATFTGHIYDTTLDIYFAEARFYDANNRTWMSVDAAKDGNNWYQYCNSNPTTYWDPTGMSWWEDMTRGVREGLEKAGDALSNAANTVKDIYNKGKDFISEKLEPVTEFVSNVATDVKNKFDNAVEKVGGYFKELACDVTMWWTTNKTTVIKTAIGVGAFALSLALAPVTGGSSVVLLGAAVGAGIGAVQGGLNSYFDQKASGLKTNWLTIGKESLEGGLIGGFSGFIGGKANELVGPFESFCGKGPMEVFKMIGKKWAIGTAADTTAGTFATYVSNRFDGQDSQQALANTISRMDDIVVNAGLTNTFLVASEAAVTPVCFVAGTMITTMAGLTAIELIQPGDIVLAQNPETGEIAYKQVLTTFQSETDTLVHINVNGETITCTEEHPFYVEGKGWVNASALHAGMVVWLADGTKAIIQDVWIEYLIDAVAVYNFRVEDFHTYFVGYSGILVHNANCGNTSTNEIPWSSKNVKDAASDLQNGANTVTVKNRSEAEELFLGLYQGDGYTNTTGMNPMDVKEYYGSKAGTYHWDDTFGEDGYLLDHGPGNRDSTTAHLQIHPEVGNTIRIFFGTEGGK